VASPVWPTPVKRCPEVDAGGVTSRLLLISDTHIPGRARRLPDAVLREADAADLIVHAGDWVAASVLEELQQHGEVLGVYGNNDGDDVRAVLPEVARRTVEGLRLLNPGSPTDRRRQPRHTMMRALVEPDGRVGVELLPVE